MYTIGELSKIVRISIDTLRYYDEIGLLKPHRNEQSNNYRYYSDEQVKDLLFILELKQYNFSLDAIRELLNNRGTTNLQDVYQTKLHELTIEMMNLERLTSQLNNRILELQEINSHRSYITKVLIIDDSPFMRQILSHILEQHGCEILGQATNGYEGIDKYIELKPDITILNVFMPEMDGITVVKRIREIDRNGKIIMCSAMGYTPVVLKCLEAGANDFVVKPFNADFILEVIEKNTKQKDNLNLNTIKALLLEGNISKAYEKTLISQRAINKLLNICTMECTDINQEVEEFKNMLELEFNN